MSQNITLWGASYSAVPSVDLPKTGGGTARFVDVSSTTATAGDVASGMVFFASDGTQTTGTASGGGGSSWELMHSSEHAVSTTSTSAGTAFTIALGSSAYTKDEVIWVRIRDKAGPRAGHFYGSDAIFINANKANGGTSTLSTPGVVGIRYSTSSQYAVYASQYGVYGYSISSSGSLTVRRRYNSSSSLTIDGTYVCEVYKLTLPAGETLFG